MSEAERIAAHKRAMEMDLLEEAFWGDGGWADQIYDFLKKHASANAIIVGASSDEGCFWRTLVRESDE